MKKRNTAFALLYVFGILLILFRHFSFGTKLLFEYAVTTSVYLVFIFFFASGYFYSPKNEEHIFKYILKKFLKFIVPFFVGMIVYGLIATLVKHFMPDFPVESITWQSLLIQPWTNSHQFFFNLASWILVPLFINQVIYVSLSKIMRFKFKELVILAISIAIGVGGLYLSKADVEFEWKLFLIRFMVSMPFFSIGYVYKTFIEKYDDKVKPWIILSIELTIFIGVYFLKREMVDYTPSMGADLNVNPFVYYFIAILAIHFILKVCKLLAIAFENSKIVDYISKHTFSIMMNHLLGGFILNLIFLGLNRLIPDYIGFNENRFMSDAWYYCFPHANPIFIVVYIIFALAFSLGLAFLYDLLKKLVIKLFITIKNKKGSKKEPQMLN